MSKILISILLSLGLCSGGAGVRYFNSNNISHKNVQANQSVSNESSEKVEAQQGEKSKEETNILSSNPFTKVFENISKNFSKDKVTDTTKKEESVKNTPQDEEAKVESNYENGKLEIIQSHNENKEVTQSNNEEAKPSKDKQEEKPVENNKVEKETNKDSVQKQENKPVEMKEIILQGKKVFVTIQPIMKKGEYLGSVITLMDRNDIRKIAKEITGVDEVVKNLRANVHEFRNNLHVILGLIQLGEYEEARKYILKTQKVHENNSLKFSNVEDYYVRGLLLSRELVAKERGVNFILTEESFLFGNHNYVDSYDIVTILGNLIENAFDSCVCSSIENKEVEVTLYEDDEKIEMQVRDNGKPIDNNIKERIFELGVSSKGEGRGTGLSLVKNRVELYDGCIDIEEFNEEKIFIITILKGEK